MELVAVQASKSPKLIRLAVRINCLNVVGTTTKIRRGGKRMSEKSRLEKKARKPRKETLEIPTESFVTMLNAYLKGGNNKVKPETIYFLYHRQQVLFCTNLADVQIGSYRKNGLFNWDGKKLTRITGDAVPQGTTLKAK